jgi:DNA polymerase III sliding clamp (beta) subunit (PCNA family)
MTIRVNADLFRLAYAAVSKEETRYYLNGVHIEPHPVKGAVLVSTDGHRMVCIHDDQGDCDQNIIVQLPSFALALCASKKGRGLAIDRRVLEIDPKSGTATIVNEHVGKDKLVERSEPLVTAHRAIIDGTFPDWRRVTPHGEMEAAGLTGFSSKFIAELGKFGQQFGGNGMHFLRQKDAGEGSPVAIRWSRIEHIFAVLMPMRSDIVTAIPSFVSNEPVPAIAAE